MAPIEWYTSSTVSCMRADMVPEQPGEPVVDRHGLVLRERERLDVEGDEQAVEGERVALLVGRPDREEAVDVAVAARRARQQRLDAEAGDHRLHPLRVRERRRQPGPHGVGVRGAS